ncbi:MAG: hypothetical protein Q8P13_02615 [bacterium]|nr:hypothetical protein [bacterium]
MLNALGLTILVISLMVASSCLCLATKFNEEGRLKGSVVSLVLMLCFGAIASGGLLLTRIG